MMSSAVQGAKKNNIEEILFWDVKKLDENWADEFVQEAKKRGAVISNKKRRRRMTC